MVEDIDNSDVLYMYEVERMTVQSIADYYGVSWPTIYYRLHPEKMKEQNDKHREYKKEYNHTDKYKEANKIYQKDWRESEEGKDSKKRWRQSDKGKATLKRWQQTDKGILLIKKANSKHRELGFIPLNEYFEYGVWHHIDEEHVICIPVELHRSIRHNVRTGEGMEDINTIAFRYITEEMFDKLLAGEV